MNILDCELPTNKNCTEFGHGRSDDFPLPCMYSIINLLDNFDYKVLPFLIL